jgi:hypothetical protein
MQLECVVLQRAVDPEDRRGWKHRAENLCSYTEFLLSQYGWMFDLPTMLKLKNLVAEVRKAVEADDEATGKHKTQELDEATDVAVEPGSKGLIPPPVAEFPTEQAPAAVGFEAAAPAAEPAPAVREVDLSDWGAVLAAHDVAPAAPPPPTVSDLAQGSRQIDEYLRAGQISEATTALSQLQERFAGAPELDSLAERVAMAAMGMPLDPDAPAAPPAAREAPPGPEARPQRLASGHTIPLGRARPQIAYQPSAPLPARGSGEPSAAASQAPDRGKLAYHFSAFYPEKVSPEDIGKIIAYAHLEAIAQEVAREATQRLHLPSGAPIRAASVSKAVPRQSVIKVTPDVPGLVFENTEATMALWEDKQSVEFRFKAAPSAAGQVCRGWVHYWLEGLVLADVPVVIFVAEKKVPDIFREALAKANARPYRTVFPSYSRRDAEVVERLETYAAAFGDEYLRDVHRLRAGQRFSDELVRFIKQADVFQLFWSENAASSEWVQFEWREALRERTERPDPYFLRPVYWTAEPAPIPDALKELHFAKVPL